MDSHSKTNLKDIIYKDSELPDDLKDLEALKCTYFLYKARNSIEKTVANSFPLDSKLDIKADEINVKILAEQFKSSEVSVKNVFEILGKLRNDEGLESCWAVEPPNRWFLDHSTDKKGIFISRDIVELIEKYKREKLNETIQAGLSFY